MCNTEYLELIRDAAIEAGALGEETDAQRPIVDAHAASHGPSEQTEEG